MRKGNNWLWLLVAAGFLLAYVLSSPTAPGTKKSDLLGAPAPVTTTFDQVQKELADTPATVRKITFVKSGPLEAVNSVEVELTNGTKQVSEVPGDAGSARLLELASKQPSITVAAHTEKKTDSGSGWLSIALNVLLLVAPIIFIFWFMRNMGGGSQMGKFAKSGAQKIEPSRDRKTFNDVAGCENAKLELMEIVHFLRNPGRLQKLGGRPKKGVLLVGDPGNGKTLMAKAVAGEANVPFFQMSGSQFVEMFVGVGASRVRDLFNTAREHQPCIIFIDEIDAVGRQRGTGLGGGNDEREQTLNQLLVEMDGFLANEAIVVMAATNRADILDPALVRPGRFDMQVLVDYADLEGRTKILEVHTRKMTLASDVNLKVLAAQTPGFSGAQLEGACNEAVTVANRRIEAERRRLIEGGMSEFDAELAVKEEITLEDFDEGITRVQMGPASNKVMTRKDKENTAYHELGHAYISQVMHDEGKGGDPVTKITIVPRARALGYTQSLPQGDRYNYTDKELRARIMMAMGGRAAQEVFLQTVDTGASNDFQQASNIAYRMVTEFGMSDVGPIHSSGNNSNPFLGRTMAMEKAPSPELLNKIDAAWLKIVNECYADTKKLIETDRDCFKHIADILLDQETILGPQWEQLFSELTCRKNRRRREADGETHECVTCAHEGEHKGTGSGDTVDLTPAAPKGSNEPKKD